MKRPTREDCLALLEQQAEPAVPPYAWRIEGIPHTEVDALELAELSLILGLDLSVRAALTAVLTLARRLADLEEVVARVPRRHGPQSGVAQPSEGGAWI